MLQLIQRNDPRIEKIRMSDKKVAQAVERIEAGKSSDARLEGATSFLETALASIDSPRRGNRDAPTKSGKRRTRCARSG